MNAYSSPAPDGETVDIAIIGAGVAGRCMALRLKQAGFTQDLRRSVPLIRNNRTFISSS